MSITVQFLGGHVPMRLDARLPEGNVMLCAGHGDEHSFRVRRLGLSVECPKCGRIALSVDLIADFYSRPINGLTTPLAAAAARNAPAPLDRVPYAVEVSPWTACSMSSASRRWPPPYSMSSGYGNHHRGVRTAIFDWPDRAKKRM